MGKHEAVETKDGLQNRSVRRNARLAVGVGLSAALLATPLTSVMAEENESSGDSVAIDVSTSWVGEVGEKVELQVLANGEKVDEVTLTEETGWDYTFEALPTTQEKQPVAYSVTEKALDGYETEISGDAETGFTVSNIDADDGVLEGSVAITYKNQDGKTIAFMDVVRGKTGEKFLIEPKDIPGHTLMETEGKTSGTFAAGVNTRVEFTYQLDPDYSPDEPADEYTEGIIEAQYVNESGIEIALRDKFTGEVGTDYSVTPKVIDGYTFVEVIGGGDELVFTNESQVVTVVYQSVPKVETPPPTPEPVDDPPEEGPVDDSPKDDGEPVDQEEPVVTPPKEADIPVVLPVDDKEAPVVSDPIAEPVEDEPTGGQTPVVTPAESESEYVAMYKALAFGISYEEAVMITGTEGTIVTDNEATLNGETVLDLDQYSWTNADGDVLLLGFMDDQLVSKSLTADGNSMMEYDYESYMEPDEDEPIAESATPVSANGEKTAESQDNEKGSPKAEADESKESAAADKVTEGKKLADTATNTFNLLALGVGLLAAAGGGLFVMNRRKQANE